MELHNIHAVDGSVTKKYRKGRGIGSGNGKTAGKGHKGQNARSGGHTRLGFEGGQMPLFRRLPKRGFYHNQKVRYATVDVTSLNVFKDGEEVTPTKLIEKGLIKKELDGVKILGNGELKVALTVVAHKFSKSAVNSIEKAKGTVKVI